MRGMEGTCRVVLPSLHIGSTGNEMTGLNVIRRPHSRKKNQRVMNCQLSTSISGKHRPENARGEGAVTTTAVRVATILIRLQIFGDVDFLRQGADGGREVDEF